MRALLGGGYSHCPECDICLCLVCSFALQKVTKKVSTEVYDVRWRNELVTWLLGLLDNERDLWFAEALQTNTGESNT